MVLLPRAARLPGRWAEAESLVRCRGWALGSRVPPPRVWAAKRKAWAGEPTVASIPAALQALVRWCWKKQRRYGRRPAAAVEKPPLLPELTVRCRPSNRGDGQGPRRRPQCQRRPPRAPREAGLASLQLAAASMPASLLRVEEASSKQGWEALEAMLASAAAMLASARARLASVMAMLAFAAAMLAFAAAMLAFAAAWLASAVAEQLEE